MPTIANNWQAKIKGTWIKFTAETNSELKNGKAGSFRKCITGLFHIKDSSKLVVIADKKLGLLVWGDELKDEVDKYKAKKVEQAVS